MSSVNVNRPGFKSTIGRYWFWFPFHTCYIFNNPLNVSTMFFMNFKFRSYYILIMANEETRYTFIQNYLKKTNIRDKIKKHFASSQ